MVLELFQHHDLEKKNLLVDPNRKKQEQREWRRLKGFLPEWRGTEKNMASEGLKD